MENLEGFKGRRLLAVDLDGTVLDTRKRLTERTKRALENANRGGFLVVPISGRIFSFLKRFQAACNLDGPVIGYNGAACMLPRSGRTLFADPVDVPLSHELLAFARARNLHINFYDKDCVYFDKAGEMADYYVKTFAVPHKLVDDLSAFGVPTIKVLLLVEAERVGAVVSEIKATFADRIDVSTSDATHVEILKAGVNKGQALRRLAAMLDLGAEDVLALGDGENDVPMLQWAGRSVAVANGHEKALAAAGEVIGHCDSEAVAGFLEAMHRQ